MDGLYKTSFFKSQDHKLPKYIWAVFNVEGGGIATCSDNLKDLESYLGCWRQYQANGFDKLFSMENLHSIYPEMDQSLRDLDGYFVWSPELDSIKVVSFPDRHDRQPEASQRTLKHVLWDKPHVRMWGYKLSEGESLRDAMIRATGVRPETIDYGDNYLIAPDVGVGFGTSLVAVLADINIMQELILTVRDPFDHDLMYIMQNKIPKLTVGCGNQTLIKDFTSALLNEEGDLLLRLVDCEYAYLKAYIRIMPILEEHLQTLMAYKSRVESLMVTFKQLNQDSD